MLATRLRRSWKTPKVPLLEQTCSLFQRPSRFCGFVMLGIRYVGRDLWLFQASHLLSDVGSSTFGPYPRNQAM